jgi:hypothetical protein
MRCNRSTERRETAFPISNIPAAIGFPCKLLPRGLIAAHKKTPNQSGFFIALNQARAAINQKTLIG